MSAAILNEYKLLLSNKLSKYNIDTTTCNNVVGYLYENNTLNIFINKMYDIVCAIDNDDNKIILSLINDVSVLNNSSAFDMCPTVNQPVFDEIEKKKMAEIKSYTYYNTEFTCKKCKHNKTTILFVNKHLSADEASSLKIICVNCSNEWYR